MAGSGSRVGAGASTSSPSTRSLRGGGEGAPDAVDEVGADGEDRAHRQRGDHRLPDADQDVHADHGREHLADRDVGGAADPVEQRERGGRRRYGDERGDERRGRRGPARARQQAREQAEHPVRHHDGDHAHDGDVHAERGESAVREEDALHQQHHGEAEHRRIRPDQDRGQGPSHQMAAGTGGHREVQHLYGEDEGGHQPGERGGALVQFATGPPEADGHRARGEHPGGDGDRCIDESIGYMHDRGSASCGSARCPRPRGRGSAGGVMNPSIIVPSCEPCARAEARQQDPVQPPGCHSPSRERTLTVPHSRNMGH